MHFHPNNCHRMEYNTERLLVPTFASAKVLPFSRVCIPECIYASTMNIQGLTIMRARSFSCSFIRA